MSFLKINKTNLCMYNFIYIIYFRTGQGRLPFFPHLFSIVAFETGLVLHIKAEKGWPTFSSTLPPTQPLNKGELVTTICVGGNSVLGSGREGHTDTERVFSANRGT